MSRTIPVFSLTVSLLFTQYSSAQITYVDANTSNTTLSDESPFTPAAEGSNGVDDNWEIRDQGGAGFGNSGVVYEANGATPEANEDAPALKTKISGLTPGLTYDIYIYFWSADSNDNWHLKAGLNPASGMTTDPYVSFPNDASVTFSRNGSASSTDAPALASTIDGVDNLGASTDLNGNENGGFFTNTVLVTEDNRALYQVYLGSVVIGANGEVDVYVDDLEDASGPGLRTWYDGVGYIISSIDLTPGVDDDGDGLDNVSEIDTYNTNPILADTDGDDISDGEEVNVYNTNPLVTDTDGDGVDDGLEVAFGTDPNDENSSPAPPMGFREIAPNGVWTWFNDERAIWHLGKLYAGYVQNDGLPGITQYDPSTGISSHTVLGTPASFEIDDHNNPSITVLPDDRLLVVYSRHNETDDYYYRLSNVTEPKTLSDWSSEIIRDTSPGSNGNNNTYANTYRLSEESDRIFSFHRQINFNPSLSISDDNGLTFADPIHVIDIGKGRVRPYPKYWTNDTDRIDLIYTDGHPDSVNNSIYHIKYESGANGTPGNFTETDGTQIRSFSNLESGSPIAVNEGAVVYDYKSSSTNYGTGEDLDDFLPGARAWTWDIAYQSDIEEERPVCAFQVQLSSVTGSSGFRDDRIYYYYAKWDGSEWKKTLIAQGGRPIYKRERWYGGGMAIDPDDTNVVYISSNHASPFDLSFDPNPPSARQYLTNTSLNGTDHYEIYRGVTTDGGETFTWEAITLNSTEDNLRPIVPAGHGYAKHALWFAGRYSTFTSYDTRVIAFFENPLENIEFSYDGSEIILNWKSIPEENYRIFGSTDFSFDQDLSGLIKSQGASTTQAITLPSPLDSADAGFFRVKKEESP